VPLGFLYFAIFYLGVFSGLSHAIEIAPDQLCRRVSAEVSTEINFQSLKVAGLTNQEAARTMQAHLSASRLVTEAYEQLNKLPEAKLLSPKSLWENAVDIVRNKASASETPYLKAALKRLKERGQAVEASVARGEAKLQALTKLFNEPTDALKGPKTTAEEDYTISMLALARLQKGDPANAAHVMDLIRAAQEPGMRETFEAAGISQAELIRSILLHDLGKQYNAPELSDYRAFLETVFPDASQNFLNTRILPHEFGSMILVEQLAKEAGIAPEKVPRLQALLGHHNAGYNPKLSGNHFWVANFAWPVFAKKMAEAGVPLPEIYEAVRHQFQGGDKENVALSALDRGVSLSLASQEKFSTLLLNTSRWTAADLKSQLIGNANNVPLEVDSVVGRFKSYMSTKQSGALQSAFTKYFGGMKKQLVDLGEKLERDAALAPAPDGINGQSVAYLTGQNHWVRVSNEGKAYQWANGRWLLFLEGKKADAPEFLFRRVIFPDLGYEPPVLTVPKVLQGN